MRKNMNVVTIAQRQRYHLIVKWVLFCFSMAILQEDTLGQGALPPRIHLGALSKTVVEFEVSDEDGNPIPDADASVFFIKSDSLANLKSDRGRTGEDGHLRMGGFSTGEVWFQFTKDGYYRTGGRVWFQRQGHVADGVSWEQDKLYGQNFWPETGQTGMLREMPCRVVMKKVLDLHPMRAFDVDSVWPDDMESLGFDFEKGDWVPPRGKGEQADVWFSMVPGKPGASGEACEGLEVKFGNPGSGNGYVCEERDYWSERGWLLVAPETGYEEKLLLSRDDEFAQALEHGEKYLVVRTRAKRDEEGNIVSARYGLIRLLKLAPGRLASTRILFFGWMNLQDNERGLESTYSVPRTVW
jgi:hypothetical protein